MANVPATGVPPAPAGFPQFLRFPNELKDMVAIGMVDKPGVLYVKLRRVLKDGGWSVERLSP